MATTTMTAAMGGGGAGGEDGTAGGSPSTTPAAACPGPASPATAPPPSILDRVRTTCHACVAAGGETVAVDAGGVVAYARALVLDVPPAAMTATLALPLKFSTPRDEINTWMLLQALNFGSGYRHALHTATGCGAWETMVRGMVAAHITGHDINTDFMTSFTLATVPDLFGFTMDEEVAVMPAVYQTKPGPLRPLAVAITRAVNEVGQALMNRGFTDMYACIEAHAPGGRFYASHLPATTTPRTADFVDMLASIFPPFRDVTAVPGVGEVWLCKKAQVCAATMARRFGSTHPHLFAFHDLDRLTIMADNVVPAVMRSVGVLTLSAEVERAINDRVPIPAGSEETRIRAAAVVAGEAIVAQVHALATDELVRRRGGKGGDGDASWAATVPDANLEFLATLTEADLDNYLWTVGKQPKYRSVERHATQDTYYY